jgi:hypothetical protein
MIETTTEFFFFGLVGGVWLGLGVAPAISVWTSNPMVGVLGKMWASTTCLYQGPIAYILFPEWLNKDLTPLHIRQDKKSRTSAK